jgi:hypothetical protein
MTTPVATASATAALPAAAPDVAAEAVESLSARLRKNLDAAIGRYAAEPVTLEAGAFSVTCGEDAVVTLRPGPSGAVTQADQAVCTCLLAPRCLHRAAVLNACPVAAVSELDGHDAPPPDAGQPELEGAAPAVAAPVHETTPAQIAAAAALWSAAAVVLAAGIPAAGAVPQAELLRAAHTARLAGLHRAEAAALRVVRSLRNARARKPEHRLGDLVAALRELLFTSALLAAAIPDPSLIGVARRAYEPGGVLRVHGVCREPVISATGYAGVVTHLVGEDGRWYSAADVKPGGAGRARAAATAPVAIGAAGLDHARLARGGLLISGATVSPEGRLGAGKGVRANTISGLPWSAGAVAALAARPLAEAAADRLSVALGGEEQAEAARTPVVCDVEVVAAHGDHLLVREHATGVVVRLLPANGHSELAHTANLRQLASRPGLRVRVVGRLEPDRAATLRPLAVGPVPDTEATLRLPENWLGHADLGYDRIQGAHLPPLAECPPPDPVGAPLDPITDAPLWRYRRVVEVAVSGGRRAVGEFARQPEGRAVRAASAGQGFARLRESGFHAAAQLAAQLADEAGRRDRDVFGRLADPDPDGYARAWLAAAAHLAATERALVLSSWRSEG